MGDYETELVDVFSLSQERNLPTWYSSMLLLACAALLAAMGAGARQARAPFATHWFALGGIFAYISIDESASFHERLNPVVDLHGVLYFGWIVPVAALLLALAVVSVPFLRHLHRTVRRRFVIAGAIYVGGALLIELPLGWWTERAGDHNLVYALLDFVEESMEILGATLFFLALLDHFGESHREVHVSPAAES